MSLAANLNLWGHALAALLLAGLGLSRLRAAGATLPRLTFVLALGLTALWALGVAGLDAGNVVTRVAESGRNLAWLVFMAALLRRGGRGVERDAVRVIYAVVTATTLVVIGLALAQAAAGPTSAAVAIGGVRYLLCIMVALGSLVLVHHLYSAVTPAARPGIVMAVLALAAMWSFDVALYAAAYVGGGWPQWLGVIRGLLMAAMAPLLAMAVHRNGDWALQLSRTAAWQSLSLAALGIYALLMAMVTGAIGAIGGDHARTYQTGFVVGSTAAVLGLLSSPAFKAWAKVVLAKHLFRHRYDYRAEWLRFTDTLGYPGEGAAPLAERTVKAVADLTDSPAGLLLVVEPDGLSADVDWRWDRRADAGVSAVLAGYLAETQRIVELDAVRFGTASADEIAAVPRWLSDREDAWVIVPLIHIDRLIGAIVLARPPIARALDWEDFDLWRVAGRQAASGLAEARAHEALADARRFDEFNRRFAFILHDIKNLVSQLSLVARNAERHADKPAFRADMIATLQDSASRMNELLGRLGQHQAGRADPVSAVPLRALAERVAARMRTVHPVTVTGEGDPIALADPARLEQALAHLLQNAIEASPPSQPVVLDVASCKGQPVIEMIDKGHGMSAIFIRDQLFKPFMSSKSGGFGLGAYEARQIVAAMEGAIEVTSREGEGSVFRIVLPPAHAMERVA